MIRPALAGRSPGRVVNRMTGAIGADAIEIDRLDVFPLASGGGNPTSIALDCDALPGAQMQAMTARFGHESGFVLSPSQPGAADFRLRFFVPRHEMEMCGHATIGALWALRARGRVGAGRYRIETLSGPVEAEVPASGAISVSQPAGDVVPLSPSDGAAIRAALGLDEADLAGPMLNARTSRTKTLVPLARRATLDRLVPDPAIIGPLCGAIGSTGLYPFASGAEPGRFHARQFPRAAGYPEDAATGVAAAALAYGLLRLGWAAPGAALEIRQGEAMGRPSVISVAFREGDPARGCWIRGRCAVAAP